MTARASLRKIDVSGREFVWKLRYNHIWTSPDRHIVVWEAPRRSCLLIDPYIWELEIRPATVSTAIRFALSAGWEPRRSAPPIILGYRNERFFVLPPGVRFTYQLTTSVAHAEASTETVLPRPSAQSLAQAVRAFQPWLDAVDLRNLEATLTEILFEPQQFWQAFHAKVISERELRDKLLACAHTYVGHAFQGSVSPQDLERVLAPVFERILFGAPADVPGAAG